MSQVWKCTNELIWVETVTEGCVYRQICRSGLCKSPDVENLVLKQKWISNTGEVEWIEVRTVKESDE
jgi:hypothetical protein